MNKIMKTVDKIVSVGEIALGIAFSVALAYIAVQS